MQNTPDEPTAIPRIPALDGLRGIAILLVVGMHFGVFAGFPGPTNLVLGHAIERVLYIGWSGVDLFFVLSGFLITSILLETRDERRYFFTFYSRRVLRIFPLYYATLIVGSLVLIRFDSPPAFAGASLEQPIWLWTFTANLAHVTGAVASFGIFGVAWSLAIEEQFYLVWPLLIRLTRPRGAAVACVVLALGALALRAFWLSNGAPPGNVYQFTLTRVDSLAIGALVALAARHVRVRERVSRIAPLVCLATLIILCAMFVMINPFYVQWPSVVLAGHSVLALFFGSLVFISVTRPTSWLVVLLNVGWLRAWGRISYGIYLLHWPLRLVLGMFYEQLPPATGTAHFLRATLFTGVGLAGSYAVGWVSYHGLEKHFLKLKRRLPYERGVSRKSEITLTDRIVRRGDMATRLGKRHAGQGANAKPQADGANADQEIARNPHLL